ncbi:MAG: hypothetical protein Q8L48_11965 [Archangium sp.]|nr:hypothetical protein [Archangium sp.]
MKLPTLTGLALMGLSACATTSGALDDDDDASVELRDHHRHHHRGGVTQFIAMSLDTIGEDDAQRPDVERLRGALNGCMEPAREIEKQLVLTFADGIATGAVKLERLDDAIIQLNATAAPSYECSADVLNKLHGLLTASEREVVADKVQAHWEIWLQVNDGNSVNGRLADVTEELNLSTAQVKELTKALTEAFGRKSPFEPKKAAGYVVAFAAAFVFPTFDARTVTPEVSDQLSAHGARRMALFYETITPFLDAEQRAELAGHLREHANHTITLSAN